MRTADLILRWCEIYTRGLNPAIAGDRRDELASDLWEHASAEPKAAAAMLSRAIRGMPADLAWRYEQRRTAQSRIPVQTRVIGGGVAALVAVAASGLIAFGAFAITRTAVFAARGDIRPWSETAMWVICLTALAVLGALLLVRRRTRAFGAIALALSVPLVHFALFDLYNKSATVSVLSYTRGWSFGVVCVMVFLILVFTSAAVLWAPTRKATS